MAFKFFCVKGHAKDYAYIMCYGKKWLEEYSQLSYTFYPPLLCYIFVHFVMRRQIVHNTQGLPERVECVQLRVITDSIF